MVDASNQSRDEFIKELEVAKRYCRIWSKKLILSEGKTTKDEAEKLAIEFCNESYKEELEEFDKRNKCE